MENLLGPHPGHLPSQGNFARPCGLIPPSHTHTHNTCNVAHLTGGGTPQSLGLGMWGYSKKERGSRSFLFVSKQIAAPNTGCCCGFTSQLPQNIPLWKTGGWGGGFYYKRQAELLRKNVEVPEKTPVLAEPLWLLHLEFWHPKSQPVSDWGFPKKRRGRKEDGDGEKGC